MKSLLKLLLRGIYWLLNTMADGLSAICNGFWGK